MDDLIRLLDVPHSVIAERLGVDKNYVKLLATGRRGAGPKHAEALAALFREHAAAKRVAADSAAERLRDEAQRLEDGAETLHPQNAEAEEVERAETL